MRKTLVRASTLALGMAYTLQGLAADPASASAEASSSQLQEVIVTAERKAESIQDVPVRISSAIT
jgi:outer membrane receptor protein involved in Fe transport